MIRFTTKVLPSRSNHLGIITLNHPKALHALTLDMIYCIQDVLLAWCQTSSTSTHERRMKAILFKSSTFDPTQQKVRSFCAGGNVKDVYLAGIQQPPPQIPSVSESSGVESQHSPPHSHGYGHTGLMTSDFFRQEYIMNHMLSQLNGSTVFTTLTTTTTNDDDTSGVSVNQNDVANNKKLSLVQPQQPQLSQLYANSKLLPIQISIWDGIVMGGGIGISIYSQYRIVTEHTIFSMPETAIGLFPDVGSLYILPRILYQYNRHTLYQPHAMCIVTYLLLTGTRLTTAYDIYTLGLATHYIPSHDLLELEKALIQATADDDHDETSDMSNVTSNIETTEDVKDVVGPVLDEYHDKHMKTNPLLETSSILLPHINDIVHAFTIDSNTTMEDIIHKLEDKQSTSTFAQQTLITLNKMSPTSLKLTLMGLQRHLLSLPDTEKPTFYEELQYEYRIAQHCMKRQNDNDDCTATTNTTSDFYEGIRATLIDKDYTPKWSPSTIHDVTDESIRTTYIKQSIPNEWELPKEYNLLTLHDDAKIQVMDNDPSIGSKL